MKKLRDILFLSSFIKESTKNKKKLLEKLGISLHDNSNLDLFKVTGHYDLVELYEPIKPFFLKEYDIDYNRNIIKALILQNDYNLIFKLVLDLERRLSIFNIFKCIDYSTFSYLSFNVNITNTPAKICYLCVISLYHTGHTEFLREFSYLAHIVYPDANEIKYAEYSFGGKDLRADFLDPIYKPRKSIKALNTAMKIEMAKPKVALLISGMLRNKEVAYKSIKENIIDTLNPDVFVSVWDKEFRWPGLVGGQEMSRLLGPAGKLLPKNLSWLENFRVYFPKTTEILSQASYSTVTQTEVENFYDNVIECKVNSEKGYEEKYKISEKLGDNRLLINCAKMFFNINEVVGLMRKNELENNFKYDYVIRIRPDYSLFHPINYTALSLLNNLDIIIDGVTDYGTLSDNLCICDSNNIEPYSKIFDNFLTNLPKDGPHKVLTEQFIDNGIDFGFLRIHGQFSLSNIAKLPNFLGTFNDELESYEGDKNWVSEFNKVVKNNG
ncbi:hypothetical protein FJN13_16180 [Alteromonas mediterranea]|uniref:hypothetical protein n=1 Tax=Alteromonas mediterranea TaxID=314275 RepID=UPI0011323D28|nr:hypothetical protein [Alteromonas mediterranea]QDG36250.1 hypothetical protein FJN13_16180 [Alteromonas mediterranea]